MKRRNGKPGGLARKVAERWRNRPAARRAQMLVIEQMGRLIRAGIPLLQVLAELEASARVRRLRTALHGLRTAVEKGSGLAAAARDAGALFAPAECGLLEAGEKTGRLPEVLDRLAATRRRNLEVRRRLVMGSIYPMILLLSSAALIPLPHLLMGGFKAYLPEVFKTLLTTGAIVGAILIAPTAVRLLGLGGLVRKGAWWLPPMSVLYRKKVLADALHGLATGLSAGLGIHESLAIGGAVTGDPTAVTAFEKASRAVAAGAGLAEAMGATGFLPGSLLVALAGGEKSGTLVDSLTRLSADLEKDINDGLKVAIIVANILILVTVTAVVAMRVFSSAQSLMPGGGGAFDELEKELMKQAPYKPFPGK